MRARRVYGLVGESQQIRHRDRPAVVRGGMGPAFVCDDPTTWPCPTAEWKTTDPNYGQVRISCWSGLHAIPQNHEKRGTRQARPLVRGTLIRLEVERLPKPTKVPVRIFLWWGGPEPPDLTTIWRVYVARFSIEHTFRFFKQVLKWTAPKLRSPEAADRWTWLVILAYVQLRLARPLVADHRLPWQAPLPLEKLTPARVRRAKSATSAEPGPSGERTKTLWALARTPQRATISSSQAISSSQNDRVSRSKPILRIFHRHLSEYRSIVVG